MMEQSSPSSPSISEINPSPAIGGCSKRRPRKPISCEPCRRSKLRCDRQLPCGTCLRKGWQGSCTYDRTQTGLRHKPSRRKVRPAAATESNPQAQSRATEPLELALPRNQSQSQSPGPMESRWDAVLRRPTTERNEPVPIPADVPFTLSFGPSIQLTELLAMLPPNSVCEYLVSRYFVHLSPLFHILHGPTFQRQYSSFVQDPLRVDLSWLALLFAICSSTLKTIEPGDPVLAEPGRAQYGAEDLSSLSQRYRDAAMMSLSQDQFLVRHNLNTLEAILILIHTISHSDGAEHGWALLGNALNIAIALRCHTDTSERSYIEKERRRRCWAGVLILHTYQALLFRDVDISYLLNIKATMPTAVNDNDIQGDAIITSNQQPSSQLTGMSLMNFQIRLLYLSTRICCHISGPDRLNEELLRRLDSEILEEQRQWDSVYLVDGAPSILNTASYAHWCVLQTHAYQLYLLLHRPFHHSRSGHFRLDSRDVCIKASAALLDLHRQFYELPRLKCYRWLVTGTMSCNALHGAVALTSCLLDMSDDPNFAEHSSTIDAAVLRMEEMKKKSPACASVYPILRNLQCRLSEQIPSSSHSREDVESRFEDWVSSVDWFKPDSIDWDFLHGVYTTLQPEHGQEFAS